VLLLLASKRQPLFSRSKARVHRLVVRLVVTFFSVVQDELGEVEKDLARVAKVSEQYQEMRNDLDIKEREIQVLQAKMDDGSHGRLLEEIKTLKTTIGSLFLSN